MNYIVILDQWFFQTSFQKRIIFCFEGGGKRTWLFFSKEHLLKKQVASWKIMNYRKIIQNLSDLTCCHSRKIFFSCHLEHACPPLKNLLLDRARFSHISANLSLANLKAYHAFRKASMYLSIENHKAQDLFSEKAMEYYFQHFHMYAT